jgi:CBS domain-containing protein
LCENNTELIVNSVVPLPVRNVMSSPVITVKEATSVDAVAQLMGQHGIGSVIVTNEGGIPLGIITERDLALRVVAKGLEPKKVPAKSVMSSPLVTIDPDQSITLAARWMSRLNIRRLAVVSDGKLIGIVTSKDITAVMPELIKVIEEDAQTNRCPTARSSEAKPHAGYCEGCGNWSNTLKESEGRYLCEECQADLWEWTWI